VYKLIGGWAGSARIARADALKLVERCEIVTVRVKVAIAGREMIGTVRQIVKRVFQERRIAIQSRGNARYLHLTRNAQIAGLCVFLVGVSAVARMSASYVVAARKMAHKEAAIVQAEMSNSDLRNLVSELQQRLAAATADNAAMHKDMRLTEQRMRVVDETRAMLQAQREDAQNRLKGAEDALNAKSGQVARVSRRLDTLKTDLKLTEQQRLGLTARVRQLETDLREATQQVAQLKGNSEALEQKLQVVSTDRAKIMAERDRLSNRLATLETARTESSAAPKAADATAAPNRTTIAVSPGAAGKTTGTTTLGRLASDTIEGWGDVQRLLASAGVDLDQLAERFGAVHAGQGGPFISARNIKQGAGDAAMPDVQKLLKTLPLAAPLEHYQLESGFGSRVDPMNRHESFHSGLDFSAAFKSPVYNTAPGTVVYAGPKGDYGKVVEIDHGGGIVTRYAHLHRIMVAKGQHLNGRAQIGMLGSTGRSTGPHVHYEVLVNGTAQDPEKFLLAGKSMVSRVNATK
jgi:murein DD-endopeptidase MepM/ murein hydrolase activator NlpD